MAQVQLTKGTSQLRALGRKPTRSPFEADVGISGERIVAVGRIAGRGVDEIDAHGLPVTPGFVDPHTHYDAQVMWAKI
jgi:N-acyl-D-aspartate/D-glutamate deacylase